MLQLELLEAFKRLPVEERLALLEAALHSVREDLQRTTQPAVQPEDPDPLVATAQALLPDYLAERELTAFTALDRENFYADRETSERPSE